MLRPIGQEISADASGVLARIGTPPSGHWARLANKVSAQLQRQYANKLFAIALRGSTARGTAVAGVSDLDLIVFFESLCDRYTKWRFVARSQSKS